MGEIILRNWDLKEFGVRVNGPSMIQQERVPIQGVITSIWGLPNPIRPVVPLISHICLYLQHRSHLHPLSLSFLFTIIVAEHKVKSFLCISSMPWWWVDTEYSIHLVLHTLSTAYTAYKHTPSTVYTEYSIHRVQHQPKIACLPFILMITSWPLIVASASGVPPYTIDRHQPALHQSSKVKWLVRFPLLRVK